MSARTDTVRSAIELLSEALHLLGDRPQWAAAQDRIEAAKQALQTVRAEAPDLASAWRLLEEVAPAPAPAAPIHTLRPRHKPDAAERDAVRLGLKSVLRILLSYLGEAG